MSEPSLLPQEVVLLSTIWYRPSHFPTTSLVSDDWHDYYVAQLEKTMAVWLQEGLLAWQAQTRRPGAFVPVAYRIGTCREDLSYIESLVRLIAALMSEPDQFYRPSPYATKQERKSVLLGVCLGNATALAVKELALQFPRDRKHVRSHYYALLDALALLQVAKPLRAEDALCDAWEALFEGYRPAEVELDSKYADNLRYQFVLAMYPLAHVGMREHRISKLVHRIYKRGRRRFGVNGWHDLLATHAMFFDGPAKYDPVADPMFVRPVKPDTGPFFKENWLGFVAPA